MQFEDIPKSYEIKPNYMLIPVYKCNDMEEFNDLLKQLDDNPYIIRQKIKRTRSGGICVDTHTLMHEMPGYEVTTISTGCEILVLSYEFGHCRIQFRPAGNSGAKLNMVQGRQAFDKFKKDCAKLKINLQQYYMNEDSAIEVKKQIEKPYIDVLSPSFLNITMDNVHHLDINSSYPAGLAESHPEFAPLIQKYYESRKTNQDYKAILNLTIGFMQSRYCDYAYSQLSRDAIKINNDKVRQMTKWLIEHDRVVLLRNTDGIWFKGDSLIDVYNSKELGQWHQDYTDCQFRIKSAGAYEFVCNGEYHPVVRGATKLEKTKPRSEWTWGDIYHEAAADIIAYSVNDNGYVEEL